MGEPGCTDRSCAIAPDRVSRRQTQPSRPVIGEVERPRIGNDPTALAVNSIKEEIAMSPSLALANALLYGFIAYMPGV